MTRSQSSARKRIAAFNVVIIVVVCGTLGFVGVAVVWSHWGWL